MFFRNLLLILIVSFVIADAKAQQFSGLKVGDYIGLNSIDLNPALSRTSSLQWDLNIVGLGLDISNNLLEFPKTSFISFLSSRKSMIENNFDEALEDSDHIESMLGLRFLNNENTRAHLELEVLGPGIMIQTEKISFSLFSKFRAFTHINDVPNFARSVYISDLNSGDSFELKESNLSYMDWREIGLSISTSFNIDDYSSIHMGSSVKKLDSYNVLYIKSNQANTATKFNDSIHFENANFENAFFSGLDYDEELQSYNYDNQKVGQGYAIDIGFIYQWKQSRYSDRNQKIGISFTDIGVINYQENGLYQHITLIDGVIEKSKFLDENLITELQKELEIDDKNYISLSNKQSINTPGLMQVFMDTPLTKNWNLRVSIRENIPLFSPIERPSIIMATGYYDRKWIGASFPVSIHNHQYLRLGAALRLGPLSIGTDNLVPIFLPTSLRAFNGYFTLKLNSDMFSFLKRTSYYKGPKSKQGSSKVKCYEWH